MASKSDVDPADTAPHMNAEPALGAVKQILEMGEERLAEVVSQLMSSERFVAAVQQTISASLSAKKNVDKGVSTLLSLVNVPTLDDVEKVRTRMNEVEETLAEIGARLSALNTRLQERASEPEATKGKKKR